MAVDNNKSLLIAQNTAFMFIRMIIILIIGLITSRVLLRTLGVEDFGLFNVVGSVVFFIGFLRNALTNATRRYLLFEIGKGDIENIKKVFSMSLNVHILLGLFIFLVLEIGGVWYINNQLVVDQERLFAANITFQAVLINFCLDVIRIPYISCVIAYEKMDFFAWSSLVEAFLKLIILFLLIYINEDKLIVYSILLTIVNIIIFIWYYFYCRIHFENCRYIIFWDKTLFKKLSVFSGWSTLANGTDVITVQGYNLMFNSFFGVVTNAAYGISNQVRFLVTSFVSNFESAYSPQITKSYASKELSYFHKLIISTSKISGYLCILIGVPIFINIDYLLKLWLVNPPQEAALFLKITLFHALFDMIQAPLTTAVFATGDIKGHQILMTIIKFLGLIISYIILVWGFKAYVVLICWVMCNVTCSFARTIYLRYFMNINSTKYFKDVCGNIAFVLALSLPSPVFLSLFSEGIWKLIITTILSTLSIAIISYKWGLEDFERNIVNNILQKYGFTSKH